MLIAAVSDDGDKRHRHFFLFKVLNAFVPYDLAAVDERSAAVIELVLDVGHKEFRQKQEEDQNAQRNGRIILNRIAVNAGYNA